MRHFLIFSTIFFLLSCEAVADQPPQIGNFALPTSQQPGPFISFGENMLDKNETQLFLLADDYAGRNKHFIDVIPGVLYGITDSFSIFVNIPYAASYKTGKNTSTGFEDAFAQLEYAFYSNPTKAYVDQVTIVANASVPTGSTEKNPSTGFGSPTYFIGMTFNRIYVDWLVFASPGTLLTTSKNGNKFGNSYLYQFGFGRNIANLNGWILAWLAEIDGTYYQRDKINGRTDPSSGGNIVYVTPSLWASNKNLLIQLGVGVPATQHWYGNQTRDNFLLVANLGWSIY